MNIPNRVKKQVMAEVFDRETSAMIRSFRDSGVEVSHDSLFTPPKERPKYPQPITDDIKRQAREAVWNSEICKHIRLIEVGDSIEVPLTPPREAARMAGLVAQAHKDGADLQAIQRKVTRDDFGRE